MHSPPDALAPLPAADPSPRADINGTAANPNKRRDASRTPYPRKRAIVACEACRKRKSKCDNQRPSCSSCQNLGAECVYRDGANDHSSYDRASLDIIGRINHVTELLEDQARVLQNRLPPLLADEHYVPSPAFDRNVDPALLAESLEAAETVYGTCEDILEWPIFDGRLSRAEMESLIFHPEPRDKFHRSSSAPRTRGVDESDALILVKRFLANVHIKNPVLDAADLKLMARDVRENGFQWDSKSCLVLIACALACLSTPYTAEFIAPAMPSHAVEEPALTTDSISSCSDYACAESYYFAAQKRFGIVEASILPTQCCFLFGVYEMYSLRPIRSWTSFNRASTMLQVYLRGRRSSDNRKMQRLERRLYWSCLKSECELRSELCLPSSGLARIDYPDVYPSPPCGSPEADDLSGRADELAHTAFSEPTLDVGIENSWRYYLSDIAVRRIGNRLANSFYRDKEHTWLTVPLERMVRIAEEFDLQLTQWYEYLPRLGTDEPETHPSPASEELTTLLQVRLLEFRERVYRPFLYTAIHGSQSCQMSSAIEPYVQRWLDACLAQTMQGSHRHRHHGTWYQNRKIYSSCLMLLAAVKSGRVAVPTSWRENVERCISGIEYWGKEAPDLGKAKEYLKIMLQAADEAALG